MTSVEFNEYMDELWKLTQGFEEGSKTRLALQAASGALFFVHSRELLEKLTAFSAERHRPLNQLETENVKRFGLDRAQ
jgi:hypothetical protein